MNLRLIISILLVQLIRSGVSVQRVYAQEEGLRDIRGPVAYPLHPSYLVLLWLIIMAGILVLLRLGGRYFVRRRALLQQEPPRPAWEIALDLLEKLRAKKYLDYNKFTQYYSELSNILRHYMEDYFGIRAPEMTTEEFLDSVKTAENVSEEHRAILKRFLHQADVVKFAKVSPTTEEAEQSFELARRFIMQSYAEQDIQK